MSAREIPYTGNVISGSLLARCKRYGDFILPLQYKEYKDDIENFTVRDSDIWLCGFPKTGTTWCQEMIWCLANDLDYERAKSISITERFPFFDFSFVFKKIENINKITETYSEKSIDAIINETGRRFMKTHLPFSFLPRALREKKTKAKIIYTVRNPKDVCISGYHYSLYAMGYDGSFDQFCDDFINDRWFYAPMWKNVLSFFNVREEYGDQMLIIKYEDMLENLPRVIEKMTKFLEISPLSPENIAKLADHLSFEKMKNNSAVNNKTRIDESNKTLKFNKNGDFIRCGKANQWKDVMSMEVIKKFDERTAKNFAPLGLTF